MPTSSAAHEGGPVGRREVGSTRSPHRDAPDWIAERNSCMGREDSPPSPGPPGPPCGEPSVPATPYHGAVVVAGPRGDRRLIWPPGLGGRHVRNRHRRRCPNPDRQALRGARRVRRRRAGRLRHRRRARAGRHQARAGRLRADGPGDPGRGRPDHRPPGRRQGRHPDDRAGHHRQQGLPLGAQHHLPGRPHDQRRARPRSSWPAAWSR